MLHGGGASTATAAFQQNVRDQDEEGVDVQVLIGGSSSAGPSKDVDIAVGFMRAYNRYLNDFCGKYPDKKFEVWKGVAVNTPVAPPVTPAPPVTNPPSIGAPVTNGPNHNAPVTNGPNLNAPLNKVKVSPGCNCAPMLVTVSVPLAKAMFVATSLSALGLLARLISISAVPPKVAVLVTQ